MNELALNEETINSRIYTLRDMQVMLDKDLAELYGVKSIILIDNYCDDTTLTHLSVNGVKN